MLKNFSRLSIETDACFATDSDLKFIQDYLEQVDQKIAAYEKIRSQEIAIVESWQELKRQYPQDLFSQNGRDISEICHRDTTNILRFSAVTMLFDDLDRLRDGFLIWYQTIAKSYQYKSYAQINYRLVQTVIRQFLTPEEATMIIPAFQLEQSILGS
jgi:Phycobilisome protein